MFEEAFIEVDRNSKKPYTLLCSLLLQVAALIALILVPLIYTQVLPEARLRSVFAAPLPPPPSVPKPNTSWRTAASPKFSFNSLALPLNRPMPPSIEPPIGAPPDIPGGNSTSDSYADMPLDTIPVKPPSPPEPMVAKPIPPKRIHVGTMEESRLIYKVQPAYPHIAQQIRLQGVVEFTAVISKSGSIENLQLVHGHPMLVAAARDAILQWRYKPTLLNGEPVEVITNIIVNFALTGR